MGNESKNSLRKVLQGVVDPRVTATFGIVGDIYMKTVAPVGLYQKEANDGESTSWKRIDENVASDTLGLRRYVNAVTGSDTVGDGTEDNPYQTLAKALSTITDSASNKRYVIILAPGRTVETGPVTWKPFVSLMGYGMENTFINQSITLPAVAGQAARLDFINVQNDFGAPFILNSNLSANDNIRFINCLADVTLNGSATAGASNVFFFGCVIADLVINGGQAHGYSNSIFGSTTDIADVANSYLEVYGGLYQSPTTVRGRSKMIMRGAAVNVLITGTTVGGNIASYDTDETSIPNGAGSGFAGTLNVAVSNQNLRNVNNGATAITKEGMVIVNATAGASTINLPKAASYIARELTVVKSDASANAVTVTANGAELINGANTFALAAQYKFVRIVSDGTKWFIIGSN